MNTTEATTADAIADILGAEYMTRIRKAEDLAEGYSYGFLSCHYRYEQKLANIAKAIQAWGQPLHNVGANAAKSLWLVWSTNGMAVQAPSITEAHIGDVANFVRWVAHLPANIYTDRTVRLALTQGVTSGNIW